MLLMSLINIADPKPSMSRNTDRSRILFLCPILFFYFPVSNLAQLLNLINHSYSIVFSLVSKLLRGIIWSAKTTYNVYAGARRVRVKAYYFVQEAGKNHLKKKKLNK
jgi:hypothetical protein